MNKLNIEELEDPRKLAVALGCEMVELANVIRENGVMLIEIQQRLERCLLLSGLAAGTILKLTRER